MSLLNQYNSNQKGFFQKAAIAAIDQFESVEDIGCFINLERTNFQAEDLDVPWKLTHKNDIPDVFDRLKKTFSNLQKNNLFKDAEAELPLLFALWETGIQVGELRYYLTVAGKELFSSLFILQILCGSRTDIETDKTVTEALKITESKIRDIPISNFPRQIKKLLDVVWDLQISNHLKESSPLSTKNSIYERYQRNISPTEDHKAYKDFIEQASSKEVREFLTYLEQEDLAVAGNPYFSIFHNLLKVRTFVYNSKEDLLIFDGKKEKLSSHFSLIIKALLQDSVTPDKYGDVLTNTSQPDRVFNGFKNFCKRTLVFDPHVPKKCYRIPSDIEFIEICS